MVWGVLAGALWAVANTLTVFAIRDVGLAIAFPLWNTNCLVGIFWGWLLFNELKGASLRNWLKVLGGTLAILLAALMLAYSTMHGSHIAPAHAREGILAAIGASLMWGTMYIPYRKAYLSGMNPLSFVTAFTVGELGMMLALTLTLDRNALHQIASSQGLLFWLFLGGFVWVIGDIFQQFATKYLGIGRGIPLSNTNQLWGLMWGALVFGELAAATHTQRLLVIAGSAIMILGALAISTAVASAREQSSTNMALERECDRYGLDYNQTLLSQSGSQHGDELSGPTTRQWWDYAITVAATGLFVLLAMRAVVPPLQMNLLWLITLGLILAATLLGAGWLLWRSTRFT